MAILCCVSWVSSGSSLQARLFSPYPVSQEAVLFSALSSDQKHFPHIVPVTQKSVPQLCTTVPICLSRSLICHLCRCFPFFAGSHCLWMQSEKPAFPSLLAAALWFSVPAVRTALCPHSACACHFFSNGLGMGPGLFQAPACAAAWPPGVLSRVTHPCTALALLTLCQSLHLAMEMKLLVGHC